MSNIPLNVNTVNWDVTASKVIGRLNSNLIFDVSGTSNIIFRSNNFNRLLITDTSNIDISGTAMRFRGDFSNATIANRLCFQSSITNGTSGLLVIPNGTATTGAFVVKNDSNADNGVQSGISQTSGTSFLILGSPTGSTVSGTNASIIVGGLGSVETINATTGIHTFNTAIPECSIVPTTSNQLVNKTYVDTTIPITNTSGFTSGGAGSIGVFLSFTLSAGTYMMSAFGHLEYSISATATYQLDFYNSTDATTISTYPYIAVIEIPYSRAGYCISQVFTLSGTKSVGVRFSHTAAGTVLCYGQNSYVRLT